VRSSLVMMIAAVAVLSGCGGGGSGAQPVAAVALTPATGLSLFQGTHLTVSAHVDNDATGAGVAWSLTGDGALFEPTPFSVTYIAPSTSIGNPNVVVTATSMSDSSAQSYVPITLLSQGTFGNVQPVSVNGGPVTGKIHPNAAFTSVTVCAPGTTNCQSIDGILVDTGSTGLRILSSSLPALPMSQTSEGDALNECVQFPDQSYLWGAVAIADVRIAGEVSRSLPIHALSAQNGSSIPSACTDSGARANAGTQVALRANGILGVGYQPQDCGPACSSNSNSAPPEPAYYGCSGSSCNPTFVPLTQQVTNPIVTFLHDNNGLALQFPALAGTSNKLDGVMTFGIGTQVNNQLGSATIFTISPRGTFTTNLAPTGQSLTSSVLDSGADALYFPDANIPACGSSLYFCPPASTAVTSLQVGANGAQGTIVFNVDNADTLFAGNPSAAAFSDLAGPKGQGSCSADLTSCEFIWGLPFFYGRTVFTAISGQSVFLEAPVDAPVAAPAPPWFAYTTGFTKTAASLADQAPAATAFHGEINRETR
jgi:hypothetical protein